MNWKFFRVPLLAGALLIGLAGIAGAAPAPWPTLSSQLAGVPTGSALERLIRANQDFSLLAADEAQDQRGLPLWLRVWWRKGNPAPALAATDPTRGYPHALKEILEWMMSHPDLKVPPPGPSFGPEAWNAVIGGDKRISGAQTTPRSESDVRINFNNGSQILAASNNISASGRQAQFYSLDGGATWGQTELPLALRDSFHSDPAVDWTSDGVGWAMTLGIRGNTLAARAYRSTDGGATWTFDGTPSGSQKAVDKELMWVDHSASSPFRNNIYTCYHNNNPAYVGRRTSAGWQAAVQVSGSESTGTAIGCDIKTNSAGDVFAFWPTTGNSRIVVRKSTTGGASYVPAVVVATTFDSYDIGVPSFNSRRALIYTSGAAYRTATQNLVCVAWTDLSGDSGCTAPANEPGSSVASACKTRVWTSRSLDGGATWSAPARVNHQTSKNDQFNQWLAVDETSGRFGLMYYDTVADPGRLKTDVYYQSSIDCSSWSAPLKVTTAMTDETQSTANLGNQYGDYNGLSGFLGKFFPSWTDRRTGGKEEIWTAPISDP
ncbi:MAG TPA: sialidase family protein [Thermoanaerobaculia bacterium]|nr:sialidase family protein [Thermoanaerobaculia bacterium]